MVAAENENSVGQTVSKPVVDGDAQKNERLSEKNPGAGQEEKSKRYGKLSDQDVVSQLYSYREEAYQREIEIRDTWVSCYGQYRNKQDFDDKAPWQSKITYSKAFASVKHGVANMIKLMLQARQWVEVDPAETRSDFDLEKAAPFVEDTVIKLADNADFVCELRDALEFAFISGMGALKVGWKYGKNYNLSVGQSEPGPILIKKERSEGQLAINSVDPMHLWFGPRTRDRRRFDFIIEESEADIATLRDSGGYENLDSLENMHKIDDQTYFADQQYVKDFIRYDKYNPTQARKRKQVQLWEYWGDIIDPTTQTIVARNQHIIIGNRTYILKAEDNPYIDELPPYLLFGPLLVAGRFPGQGILEMSLSVKDAIDRLAQMQEDHFKFSVIPMLEVEANALENAEGDMQTGVQPGKIFYKKTGVQGQAVQGIQFPQLSNASFNALQAMDKEYQRGTFITEQTQGLLDTKGETTATEVQATTLQSTLILADIAKHIEDTCLSPLAEMIWDRAFQFVDGTTNPTWTGLVGPQIGGYLDQLPRGQRLSLIKGKYNFKAHGLSESIQRQLNLQKYTNLLQLLAQLGPAGVSILNMPEFLKRIFDSYHFQDPVSLLAANAQDIAAQQQQGMVNQSDPIAQAQATAQAKAQGAMHVNAHNTDMQSMLELLKAVLANRPSGPTTPAPTQ